MSDPSLLPDPSSIPVSVHGFTWTAAGIWSLFALVASVLVTLIKAVGFPKLYEIWSNRDVSLRKEKRGERESLETRLQKAEKRAADAEQRAVYLTAAITLILGAFEAKNPGDPAIEQARELLGLAAVTDDPFGQAIKKLL